MTEREIALNSPAVGQLVFVDTVTFPDTVPLGFVELSARLVSLLPTEYHALPLRRESFTVGTVIARFLDRVK